MDVVDLAGRGRHQRPAGPEAGAIVVAALEPVARPAGAGDDRTGPDRQRNAEALAELARRSREGLVAHGRGGVWPQLLAAVDLDSLSLLGRRGGLGGETGWVGPLGPGGVSATGR